MLREERQIIICNELMKSGFASARHLAGIVGTSQSTIRRDIMELEAKGRVIRTRGGASIAGLPVSEPSFNTRMSADTDEKKRIAEAAIELVRPNETLLLSGGTTVAEFAKTLDRISPIYVATTDLVSAMNMVEMPNVELTLVGGTVRQKHYCVVGWFAETMLKQIHADKAILGVDAIDFNLGFMNFSSEDVSINRLMMSASKQVIVLCDHTKFHSIAFTCLCPLNKVDVLITGKEARESDVESLRSQGIDVILA